jgi:hypothetical protein
MANYNAYNNPMFNPYAVNIPQYQQPIQQMQQPIIQQGGFIPVSSEKEAMEYLVAQGTSVTFIDGKNQKMYVKTRGFSPVEQPSFKRYNFVEITDGELTPENEKPNNSIEYAEKSEIEALKGEIEHIKNNIKKLNEVKIDE